MKEQYELYVESFCDKDRIRITFRKRLRIGNIYGFIIDSNGTSNVSEIDKILGFYEYGTGLYVSLEDPMYWFIEQSFKKWKIKKSVILDKETIESRLAECKQKLIQDQIDSDLPI